MCKDCYVIIDGPKSAWIPAEDCRCRCSRSASYCFKCAHAIRRRHWFGLHELLEIPNRMGLPEWGFFLTGALLAAVYWFGLGLVQLIDYFTSTGGASFTLDGMLGLFLTGVTSIILVLVAYSAMKVRKEDYVIVGFGFSLFLQPIVFLMHFVIFPMV